MSHTFTYNIAGYPVKIETSLDDSPADRVEGFRIFKSSSQTPVLTYSTNGRLEHMHEDYDFTFQNQALYNFDFDDEDIKCFFYRSGDKYLFKMIPHEGEVHFFTAYFSGKDGLKVLSNWEENKHRSMLRFSLWMSFALAVAPLGGIPIHSSVNVFDGKAILFLGESGTGKSTHTRLWRENIPQSFLLNDDSPIIRADERSEGRWNVTVNGSPWSGKTPCYKKESYPVAAIVRLSQAPFNKITQLPKIKAFGAIYPSCPPALTHEEKMADYICSAVSALISTIPVYHLECLPDADAVFLVRNTIYHNYQ